MPPTITPARVISSPADHHVRSVNNAFEAPTRKCAISDTTAAVITPVVPRSQKNGITGTIAPMKVLTPAATAACTGRPVASVPPSSSGACSFNIASGFWASCSASRSAVSLSMPLSW